MKLHLIFYWIPEINMLKKEDYHAAYSEFKLAYKIKKEDEDLRQIMIETLIVLCKEENEYCSDLDELMSKV